MLEYVSQGIVINDFPTCAGPPGPLEAISAHCKHLFPESPIRTLARRYLHLLGECLHDESVVGKKLFSSLTFSGNHKLRLNIFLGMMFLSARNTSKRFLAIHSLPNGLGSLIGAPFLAMTTDFVKDMSEMKKLLKGVYHLVHYAWRYQESILRYEATMALQDTSIATQTESKQSRGLLDEAIQRIQPIILVGSTATQTIRMVCPSIAIITNHCPLLAQAILVRIPFFLLPFSFLFPSLFLTFSLFFPYFFFPYSLIRYSMRNNFSMPYTHTKPCIMPKETMQWTSANARRNSRRS